jgi:hypothetical protein
MTPEQLAVASLLESISIEGTDTPVVQYPPVVYEAIQQILSKVNCPFKWFVTGTFAYNQYQVTGNSDIDIVVSCDFQAEEPFLDENGEVHYAPAYFDIGTQKINVISKKDPIDFDLWRKATEAMTLIWPVCEEVRLSRDSRVLFFKKIVTGSSYTLTKVNEVV